MWSTCVPAIEPGERPAVRTDALCLPVAGQHRSTPSVEGPRAPAHPSRPAPPSQAGDPPSSFLPLALNDEDNASCNPNPSPLTEGRLRPGAIRPTPILSNWPLMKAYSYPHRKIKIWPASGESRGVGGFFRFRWGASALLLENAPKKMSAPVLDTMISHMRTARNRTLQSEKLIDY